jgi:SAM-dependent methyltransferase
MMQRGRRTARVTQAQQADKHVLYEAAVQNPEAEIDFVDATFRKLRGRRAAMLREDFCGTAGNCCEWVRRRPGNRAVGIDLDPNVLDWARRHRLGELTPAQQARVELRQGDVRSARCAPADITLALNFSYWVFKTRAAMLHYLRGARRGLAPDGVLFLDAYGGYEAHQEIEECTRQRGFTYVWDQQRYDPIGNELLCHIHFDFPDGSRLRRAFSYDWRLWSLPELCEMLEECGYRPTVYWEGSDGRGGGNGIFRPATRGEADASWIAYVVAEK